MAGLLALLGSLFFLLALFLHGDLLAEAVEITSVATGDPFASYASET